MAQNVTIAGNQYPSVPSIQIPKTGGGGNATFTDTSPTTASASDVAQGKIFFDSTGTQQTGTASGGGGTDFIVTFTEDQNGNWSPDCTFADIQAAFTAGKTISTVAYTYQADEPSPSYGYYDEGDVAFYGTIETFDNNKTIFNDYGFDSNGFVVYDSYEYYDTYDATAVPADVANGKIFYNVNGRQTGTASGGASNVVTGTFKGTTTGAAMDITLNYSGSGYPVAVVIYPTEGSYNSTAGTGSLYNLVKRYVITWVALWKCIAAETPTYNTDTGRNHMSCYTRSKTSSSDPTALTGTVSDVSYIMKDSAATSTRPCVTLRSKTKMSVFIAGTSYGFAANFEYTYWVLYSS